MREELLKLAERVEALRGTLPTHWLPLPAPPKAAPEQEPLVA